MGSLFAAAAVAAAMLVGTPALVPVSAQDYPTRPITLIVPFPAGGGVDAMARIVAERLTAALGQNVIVDNRGGGGGTIGTRAVAKAPADGYTLLLGHTGTVSINPTLYANPGYDPRRDFAAIGMIADMAVVLLAHPSFAPKTVADVIALARQEGDKLNMGTSAVGTGGYMSAELFKSMAAVDFNIIPYKGTAPVMNDLLGGHVKVAFGVLPPALGNLASGNLRAIAVFSKERFSKLPDVPTAHESGLPEFESVLRYGLLAPAGTPKPIIDRLNKELTALVKTDAVRERINAEGGDAVTSTPEEYTADIERELEKWGALIRKLNLRVN
jgi:tripartite-type tricarboxylate transporter receptor subunit TctC